MTNFDRWKQNLRIEDLLEENIFIDIPDCEICPANDYCRFRKGDCNKLFKEWAKKEYANE